MPAGLVVPISGPYLGLWDALPLGTQNDDGFELACVLTGQEVSESDAFGLTLVEAIYRGQNWRLRLRGLEWDKLGLQNAMQMFGQIGVFQPFLQQIGNRWTSFSNVLLLTSILANPPAFPQSITAGSAGIAPNSGPNFFLTSKVREMPLEFVLFPYLANVGLVTIAVPFTVL